MPPLRNRKEDIPLFADFFLKKTCLELNKQVNSFEEDVMDLFINYSWPGNLREFRNVIRRAVLLCNTSTISVDILPTEFSSISNNLETVAGLHPIDNVNVFTAIKKDLYLKDTAAKAEYEAIMKVLKEVNYNKTKAAIILNVDRKTLYNKIKNYEGSAI